MTRTMTAISAAAIAAMAFFTPTVYADQDILVRDLPAVVVEAAEKAVPGITITDAEKDIEDGVVIYELEGVVRGEDYDLEITADGKVIKVDD